MCRVVNKIDNEVKMLTWRSDRGNFFDGIREGLIMAGDKAEEEMNRIQYELDKQIEIAEENGNTQMASGLRIAKQVIYGIDK